MALVIFVLGLVTLASATSSLGPCVFDGHLYNAGETIMIAKCLATMECLGDNNYGNMVSLGGICPEKRAVDGQSGCLFDGHVYGAGDQIIIQPCLAEMTCEGHNVYSDPKPLGGICPEKREVNGQSGCLFDGHVYGAGDKIIIQPCLAEMTCEGHNVYSDPKSLGGIC